MNKNYINNIVEKFNIASDIPKSEFSKLLKSTNTTSLKKDSKEDIDNNLREYNRPTYQDRLKEYFKKWFLNSFYKKDAIYTLFFVTFILIIINI
ncbi:MAG: hypothetical protein ABF289_15220 [Clostridiales bacterium]